MENGPSLNDWFCVVYSLLIHMDQAKTLRHLLGQFSATIYPILGDMSQDYAACLARFVLEQQAKRGRTALLFDGSEEGLSNLFLMQQNNDLIEFFNGTRNLEDQVMKLGERQYLVAANQGLAALVCKPERSSTLLGKLNRIPVTIDRHYATLSYEATNLAHVFSPRNEWYWVVQPTARSVTQVFQAMCSSKGGDKNIRHRVIVAGVRNTDEADHVFSSLLESTSRILFNPLQYAGHLPMLISSGALNQVSREMIVAGRRVAKTICSFDEHALA
jgi:MinD-like ATPase involved in chromosome partitioning or flagellar assembly